MIKSCVIITLILILLQTQAKAAPVMSVSTSYYKIEDPRFKYKNRSSRISTNISAGYSYEINNVNITAFSNRIFNKKKKSKVIINGNILNLESKITYDALQIGYRKKRIMPSIFLANTKIENRIINKETKHSFTYGAGLNYFLNKNISTSIIYIAPNAELELKGGLGLNINYNFR